MRCGLLKFFFKKNCFCERSKNKDKKDKVNGRAHNIEVQNNQDMNASGVSYHSYTSIDDNVRPKSFFPIIIYNSSAETNVDALFATPNQTPAHEYHTSHPSFINHAPPPHSNPRNFITPSLTTPIRRSSLNSDDSSSMIFGAPVVYDSSVAAGSVLRVSNSMSSIPKLTPIKGLAPSSAPVFSLELTSPNVTDV
ncbi:hypothetical protein DID78_00115 [Candidatus Marinamargulisbacteria bacterium SCGC AG-343-D04]|nr:hypothetical protein DID78_00115 [Candidatus Marinamargulisbacteria bacterium SCGC AG-343-D04]